jgi:hypothetical protein
VQAQWLLVVLQVEPVRVADVAAVLGLPDVLGQTGSILTRDGPAARGC